MLMIVSVGSERASKQEAVRKAFSHYYKGFEVIGAKCESNVSDQPMADEETIRGAINRAKCALSHGDIGVGIEAGLKPVPETITGYLNTTWCAIIDKNGFLTIGSSPDFEYPRKIAEDALKGIEVSKSAAELYNMDENELKESGVIGQLSRGVMPRADYAYYSVLMALLPRLNRELF